MNSAESYIVPLWPVPARVRAVITTRLGGHSEAPFDSFNLAGHVGDKSVAVQQNRAKLAGECSLQHPPCWLNQVHGTEVVVLDSKTGCGEAADAIVTRTPERPCAVLTADCLPVLFCDSRGEVVAAAHAGWRGLASGVLRNTVETMAVNSGRLLAYLGPAISVAAFEVGEEVRDSFLAQAIDSSHRGQILRYFLPSLNTGKLMADLYGLARSELAAIGVTNVFGGDFCTFSDPHRFYSFRRDGVTGRMASLIWFTDD